MATAFQQHSDYSPEAKQAALAEFAKLPNEQQTAFLQQTFENPELRQNPHKLQDAMVSYVAEQKKPANVLAGLLQLGPELAHPGREHELREAGTVEQAAAIESLASAQVVIKQKLASGVSVETVKAEVVSQGNAAQAAVVHDVTQQVKAEEQKQTLADNHAIHQEKVNPELAAAVNPFAAALAGNMGAALAFKAALGGHTQDVHSEVAGPSGGKAASQAATHQV